MVEETASPSPRPDRAVASQGREMDKKLSLGEQAAALKSVEPVRPEETEATPPAPETPPPTGLIERLPGGRDSLLLGMIWSEVLQPPKSRRPR